MQGEFPIKPELVAQGLAAYLDADGQHLKAGLLSESLVEIPSMEYSSLNDGAYYCNLHILMSPQAYKEVSKECKELEKILLEKANDLLRAHPKYIVDRVAITPTLSRAVKGQKISEVTRRAIFDALQVQNTVWAGRLEETEFLSRIWNLADFPSTDPRHESAEGDIWRHRVLNPDDWPDEWIYSDQRFNLLRCDDDIFLTFLCEIVHPVVRTDPQEVESLCQLFNRLLTPDKFELVEKSKISDRPVFAPRAKLVETPGSIKQVKAVASTFDVDYLVRQISRLETATQHDPDLAIGTAKELIETCCKTILEERGKEWSRRADVSQLVKATCKQLKLTRDDIPDAAKASETIRRLLSNLSSVTQSLSELRNSYGTGHGKSGKTKGLGVRHAKLAVGAATTVAIFLFETHKERDP